MACRIFRIDALNFDTATGVQSTARPIVDEVRKKVYFAWSSATHTSVSIQHNYQVFFRSWDIETETWDSAPVAVSIENPDIGLGIGTCDCVAMSRIPSTGELIIFYGDIIDTYYHTSTDNGATWSSPRGLVTSAFSFQQLLAAGESPDDSVYVWAEGTSGGVALDTYLYKRNAGSSVWTAKGLFDDGGSPTNGINGGLLRDSAARVSGFKEDGLTGFVLFSRLNVGNQMVLRSYWTTDDWATINTTDIRTHNQSVATPTLPNCPQIQPILYRGRVNTDRWWAAWVETLTDEATTKFWIAHTDDWGATWTIDGSPSQFAGYDWDPDWDRAFMVDYADRLYAAVFTVDPNGTAPTHLFHTFFRRNTYGDTGWTKIECDLGTAPYESGATAGDMFYAQSADGLTEHAYRIFNYSYPFSDPEGNPVADGVTTYNLLVNDEVVPPPPGPPICIVTPFDGVINADGDPVTLCGPESDDPDNPWTYAWTGPGGFTATTRCIDVTEPGTYNLTVTNALGVDVSCSGFVVATPPPVGPSVKAIPFHRGTLPVEPSGHPSGTPAVRRVGW